MKVGDYVRTKHYGISKITDIYNEDKIELDNVNAFGIKGVCYMAENIIKSSPNIIDLIEVGDYVNGQLVKHIAYFEGVEEPVKKLIFADEYHLIPTEVCEQNEIKSIVTKEQFESMEYKIGE